MATAEGLMASLVQTVRGWRAEAIAGVLLASALVAGVIFAIVVERHDFVTALYFAVSAFQTSGLIAPSIDTSKGGDPFPPIFIAALCIVGVPLWGITVGKMVELMIVENCDRLQSPTEIDKLEHRLATEAALSRRRSAGDSAAAAENSHSSPAELAVGRAEFFELWLVEVGLVTAEAIDVVQFEFDLLRRGTSEVTCRELAARLRYLQLIRKNRSIRGSWFAWRTSEGACDQQPGHSPTDTDNSSVASLSEAPTTATPRPRSCGHAEITSI